MLEVGVVELLAEELRDSQQQQPRILVHWCRQEGEQACQTYLICSTHLIASEEVVAAEAVEPPRLRDRCAA